MNRVVTSILFLVILGAAVGAVFWSQRHAKSTPVSANAVLQIAADAQRDLTRAPMQFTRISDEQEIAIGKRFSSNYALDPERVSLEELALQAYVTKVGILVSAHAHRRLPYSFHLVPDRNFVNAYSLPGGPVYIGEGMLDLMTTEDELANVLGHEIEHIDHYHCVERFQLEAKLRKVDLSALGDLLQLPISIWQAGYQKDEEFEADREGMFLAVNSGYSPYGAVSLFSRFVELSGQESTTSTDPAHELSQLAKQSLSGYFRSHPQSSERLAQANSLIAEQHWENRKNQKSFRVAYEVHNGQYVKQK